jgi:dTDP-6-deoxy-L-talose 4-dehydrogenase (NAD+)
LDFKAMILVTGANGFVGRQVVRELVVQQKPVRLVLREGAARPENLGKCDEVIETPDLFHAERSWWMQSLKGVEMIIHLAWYAEPGMYLTSQQNLDCLEGTIEMARATIDAGVQRFIGIGTCAEYDLSKGLLRADSPLNPQTLYSACKASTFQVLGQLLPEAGVEFAWCRLFYLHGEGEDSRRLVPYLHQQLGKGEPAELTSGQQIRDFLDVREAGSMIVDVALGNRQGPINICSGIPITVRQLAEQIADEYGRHDLLKFDSRPDSLFDPPCVVGVRDEVEEG